MQETLRSLVVCSLLAVPTLAHAEGPTVAVEVTASSTAKGKADKTPPCGLKYLRSSADGTYKLQATITWEITWTGTGGAGGDLPDGTFGNDQAVTVQEIQAVNR